MDWVSPAIIRHAEPADAEVICRISHEAYAQFRHKVRPPFRALTERPQSVAAEIESVTSIYGLALLGGEPVGHVRYRLKGDCLAISRLAVLPAHRKQGIGSDLMLWLENEALRWGVSRLRGEVRSIFPGLLRYYLDMGYRVTGYVSLAGIPRCLTRIEKVVEGVYTPQLPGRPADREEGHAERVGGKPVLRLLRLQEPVGVPVPSAAGIKAPGASLAHRQGVTGREGVAGRMRAAAIQVQLLHPALKALLLG